MQFLRTFFLHPQDIRQTAPYYGWEEYLKEDIDVVIRQLLIDGILRKCTTAEVLMLICTQEKLKQLSRRCGLKASGQKRQLAERLVQHDLSAAATIVAPHADYVVQCSEEWAAVLVNEQQILEKVLNAAKLQSYDALLRGDIESAYDIHFGYARVFATIGGPNGEDYEQFVRSGPLYDTKYLSNMLSATPEIVTDMDTDTAKHAKVAACMCHIWSFMERYSEPDTGYFLPFVLRQIADPQKVLRDIRTNAKLRESLEFTDAGDVIPITFCEEAPSMCIECAGKEEMTARDLLAFPRRYCTWDEGCPISIGQSSGIFSAREMAEMVVQASMADREVSAKEREASISFFSRVLAAVFQELKGKTFRSEDARDVLLEDDEK